jgi:hypothetical protein
MLREPNAAVWCVIAGPCCFLCGVRLVPGERSPSYFAPVRPEDLGLCLLAGTACLGYLHCLKSPAGGVPRSGAILEPLKEVSKSAGETAWVLVILGSGRHVAYCLNVNSIDQRS